MMTLLVHSAPPILDGADVQIYAPVEREGTEPQRHEELWGRPLGEDGEFEVGCIPFFLYDVALGDHVRARREGDCWIVDEMLSWAGHFTYRVWFGGQPSPGHRRVVAAELAERGAVLEWSSENLL